MNFGLELDLGLGLGFVHHYYQPFGCTFNLQRHGCLLVYMPSI